MARRGKAPYEVLGYDGDWRGEKLIASHTEHRIHGKYTDFADAERAAERFMREQRPRPGGRRPWVEIMRSGEGQIKTWRAADGAWAVAADYSARHRKRKRARKKAAAPTGGGDQQRTLRSAIGRDK